ncbi:MAG: hypothetical protein IKV16_02875 [Clostridia bacterium]|nr:hypothetical protein [Clostridia bacterium]
MNVNFGKKNVFLGVKIGEHSFNTALLIDEIKKRAVDRGFKFVYLRPSATSFDKVDPEDLINLARYLAENEIYFFVGNNVQAPPYHRPTQLAPETAMKLKEVSKGYFLGDAIREPGSELSCKAPGYFSYYSYETNEMLFSDELRKKGVNITMPKLGLDSMSEGHDYNVELISRFAKTDRENGMPYVFNVEATALIKYNLEAGVDIVFLELMCANPDFMLPITRGALKAYGKDFFGTLIAHEWFGGFKQSDPIKLKRLSLATKFAYMSGSNVIMLESGDEAISSYDQKFSGDSEICATYRQAFVDIKNIIYNDERPSGFPKAKFAFIYGNDDAWPGFCHSSVWNQFLREEWGHGDAENSWRLLDSVGTKRNWADNENYGTYDLSAFPAYGTYDITPIEADIDILSQYEYLVFLGWNTMTDENMDKLYEYVRRGGKILLTGAHLNYNARRDGKFIPPSAEKLLKLCGIRYKGTNSRTNYGSKFEWESVEPQHLYPGTKNHVCDALFSAGYVDYMNVELVSAKLLASTSDAFGSNNGGEHISVIENRIGKGTVTLLTSPSYPGNPGVTPLYRALLREHISASARNCDIKVIASDKLRYTVYEGDKIYLLNTDYDLPIIVKIIKNGNEQLVTVNSLELKIINL